MLAPQTTRRRIRPGVVLLGGVVVLILLFLAALSIGWLAAKQRVRAELARIRAAGEPVSPEDLEAFYQKPPADRDTTQLWLDAIAALDTPEFFADAQDLPIVGEMHEAMPQLSEPWPQQPAVEVFLAKHHESLEKMHRAAELGGEARYPMGFEDGLDLLPVIGLRNGADLLKLESEVAARHRDYRGAAAAVEVILAEGQSLANDPTLFSQLARMTLDGIARGQLERLLGGSQLSDEELSAIERRLAEIDYTTSYHRALLGDRAMRLECFANPTILRPDLPRLGYGFFRPSDQALYLRIMAEVIAAFRTSGPTLRDAVADVQAEKRLAHGPGAALRYPIAILSMPPLESCAEEVNQGIANRDAAGVAVAIERFRLRHQGLPKSLDALVPEFLPAVPLDPFDGEPLRYRVDETEYRVYSIGPNGIDEGGQVLADLNLSLPVEIEVDIDLVFRVRLSEPPAQENEPR